MWKRSKYNNKKVVIEDEKTGTRTVFDSEKEYHRWCQLKLMEEAGEIRNLERQVPYELIPAQYSYIPRYGKKGQRLKDEKKRLEAACFYKADFTYWQDGEFIVEDSKGKRTADYVIKRKLMLWKHGIQIKET